MDIAQIKSRIAELITEGERLKSDIVGGHSTVTGELAPLRVRDYQAFMAFQTKCKNLARLLGNRVEEAKLLSCFTARNDLYWVRMWVGTLQALEDILDKGLLDDLKTSILAEARDDILDQASDLLQAGYDRAAGTLCRCAFEAYLRMRCQIENCMPTKKRPTLGDFISSLYAAKLIDTTQMKEAEAIAGSGNDAAHPTKPFDASKAQKLLADVRDFVSRTT